MRGCLRRPCSCRLLLLLRWRRRVAGVRLRHKLRDGLALSWLQFHSAGSRAVDAHRVESGMRIEALHSAALPVEVGALVRICRTGQPHHHHPCPQRELRGGRSGGGGGGGGTGRTAGGNGSPEPSGAAEAAALAALLLRGHVR